MGEVTLAYCATGRPLRKLRPTSFFGGIAVNMWTEMDA